MNRLKKVQGDWLFFLVYGVMLTLSILSTSFFYGYFDDRPFSHTQMTCVVLLVVYEGLNGGVKRKDWLAFCFFAFFTVLAHTISKSNIQRLVGWMFLLTFCARRIPFPKIADFSLKVSCITVAVIVLSGYLGIIDNVVVLKSGRVREYLGFRYALYPSGFLLNMTALYVYLRKEKITVVGALIWGALNWYVFYMTDSRISFLLAELLLVAALLMRWLPKIVEKVQVLWAALATTFALSAVVSVVMTILYDSRIPWMRRLNSMLEGRLNLGKRSLIANGVGWFGKVIAWVGNGLDVNGNITKKDYTYVDCLYVKILQRYGIVFTLLLLVFLTWAMFRLWKRKEYHILMISASVAVHCLLDDLSFGLHYNTFWIAMGMALIAPSMLPWNGKTNQIAPPDALPPHEE